MNFWRASLALATGALLLANTAVAPARPVAAQPCSWEGTWDTGSYGMLEMGNTGALITGTYSYSGKSGRLYGKVDADPLMLLGEWEESPAPDGQGKGLFAFVMVADCSAFGGAYGYGQSTDAAGTWNAVRVK